MPRRPQTSRCSSLPTPCVHPSGGRLPDCIHGCADTSWQQREAEWARLQLVGHDTHMRPRCRPDMRLTRSATRSFPRVFGIGLPHTGTSTLHALLVLMGCCFATHNWPSGFGSRSSLDFERRCASPINASISAECNAEVRDTFLTWQCASDNPWVKRWRLLAAAAPPGTRFILTRVPSALHYGISRTLAATWSVRQARERIVDGWAPGNIIDTRIVRHARTYAEHVAAVRRTLGLSPWYAEVCWACGDNATTLMRKVRVRSRAVHGGRSDFPPTPFLKASNVERHQLASALRSRMLGRGVCMPGGNRALGVGHAAAHAHGEWLCSA